MSGSNVGGGQKCADSKLMVDLVVYLVGDLVTVDARWSNAMGVGGQK